MEEPMEGWYTIEFEAGDYIVFNDGWDELKATANIVEGSVLPIKVEARVNALCLDFVEII